MGTLYDIGYWGYLEVVNQWISESTTRAVPVFDFDAGGSSASSAWSGLLTATTCAVVITVTWNDTNRGGPGTRTFCLCAVDTATSTVAFYLDGTIGTSDRELRDAVTQFTQQMSARGFTAPDPISVARSGDVGGGYTPPSPGPKGLPLRPQEYVGVATTAASARATAH